MSAAKSNRALLAKIPLLKAALAKHFAGKPLLLNNVELTVDQINAQLDAYAASIVANGTARAAWERRVQLTRALAPSGNKLVAAIEDLARVSFGNASDALADFGLRPLPPRTRTVAVKAEAIERSAATRVARFTLGPKQKAKIHGSPTPNGGDKPKSG